MASTQHFAGGAIYQVADSVRAFEIGDSDRGMANARLHEFFVERFGDALVRRDDNLIALGMLDFFRELAVHQPFGNIPVQFAVTQSDALHLIERAQNVLIGLDSQRPQEDRAQELALAVNANIQQVLGVVFKFNP